MREWRAAFPVTVPVMAGYVFLGVTYGILMTSNGFPPWLPVLTAAVVYTGSLEFLLVEILQSPFHPAAALATALMVGARHIFYGLAMLPKYAGTGKKKAYLAFSLSDETFALNYPADIPDGLDRGRYYLAVSALDQLYWVAGSAAGALLGSLVTIEARGLNFIMTAMFVSIFMDQWLKDRDALRARAAAQGRRPSGGEWLRAHGSELTGAGGSVICLLLFGPDRFIIPSMALVLAALTVFRGRLDPARPDAAPPEGGREKAAPDERGGGRA